MRSFLYRLVCEMLIQAMVFLKINLLVDFVSAILDHGITVLYIA